MVDPVEENILRSLRKITRAIDLYSRQLARQYQLTGPQLVCLRLLCRAGMLTAGELAKQMSLSQATVTGIIDRLETRGFVVRERSQSDRRCVNLLLTDRGSELAGSAPSSLQERFACRLSQLPDSNRASIDSVLQQVVTMMEADNIEAAPILASGALLENGDEAL